MSYHKINIEFDMADPEGRRAFADAVDGSDLRQALWDISQELFRPARKHGYPDPALQELLEKKDSQGAEIIALLEEKFFEILRDRNVELD